MKVLAKTRKNASKNLLIEYRKDTLLKRNPDLCHERKRNIQRLLFVEKKQYEDQLETTNKVCND